MPLGNGEMFAGYRILRFLGSGGMGEVYLAKHPRLPRLYALKVLPPELSDDANYRERFNREADLAATLYHPHIVGVHDRGEHAGQLWISMDYVEGLDAGRLLETRFPSGMPPQRVIEIVTATASALDYAHKQRLLHRDVKPANIMLTARRDDTDRRIMLTDFGIARIVDEVSGLTATNMVIGTVYYAAPEQLMDETPDGRADQYALAITAYELLSGSVPFKHPNPAVVIGHHQTAKPPPLAESRPELASVDRILATALSKNRDDRFPTCMDFARALESAHLQAIPPTRLASPILPASAPTKNHPTSSAPTKTYPAGRPPTKTYPAEQPPTHPARDAGSVGTNSSRWLRTAGAVVVILLLIVVAFTVRQDRATNEPTNTPTSAITFEGMRDFVTGYFSDLPAHPDAAWAKRSPHAQNQTGQSEFVDFWASIQSVRVVSISPRDATSVVARLRYVRNDRTSKTEDAWLRMVLVDGAMLLDESGQIGPVDETATPTTTTPMTSAFPYQPLWPFASQEEADRWLREDAPRGDSPWHADPEATALYFTRNFLGFTEIDRVTAVTNQGDKAWVDVGQPNPKGEPVAVATIHLARFGTAPDAPWEVVGTQDDDSLTLETPPYGSTVGPVIEAGGRINGVDECIALEVRQSTQQGLLGEFRCLMAGGAPDGMPWSAQVTVTGAQPGVLILVAVVGGHYATVEGFAITGLRVN